MTTLQSAGKEGRGGLVRISLKTLSVLCIFILALLKPAQQDDTCPDLSNMATGFARSNSEFSIDLYKVLSKKAGNENLVFSPASANIALAMAYFGSAGNTETEMKNALHLHGSKDEIADSYKAIVPKLKGNENVTLDIGNRLFIEQTFEVLKEYSDKIVNVFAAEPKQLDFKTDVPGSVKFINDWVEEVTRNKIKDLVSKDSIDQSTKVVLVNGIYFKGDWLNKFDEELTEDKPFYTDATNSVNVPMMFQSRDYRYGEIPEIDAKAIEIPYKDERMKMLIILPNERTGLANTEEKLASTRLNVGQICNKLSMTKVDLTLPKFKLESTHQLVQPLQELGMKDIFTDSANLSGISASPLVVSEVIQKAFIEVNEKGSEAAAATAVIAVLKSFRPAKIEKQIFKVDHPFMFALLSDDVVLFAGKLNSF